MEENKKNNPPRKEGGHYRGNNRRDGHKGGNQGGQRISVRPGSFVPPAGTTPPAAAPATPTAPAERPVRQESNLPTPKHRNGPHKNKYKNKAGRTPAENPTGERKPAANDHKPAANDHKPAANDRRDNRRGRGDNNRHREEPVLSASMQSALDEEFGTPLFTAPVGGAVKDKRQEAVAVDSEEFKVDIATAAYLIEDIPCGFPVPDGKSVEVVGVRFRHAGKVYFFAPGKESYRVGESVLVDTARGPELGEIVMLKRRIAEKDVIQPLRAVLRKATEADKAHEADNRVKEAEALKICEKKIAAHKLEMNLVDAQYTFDNSKLLFYFTAEGRVDFRDLVRDLAGEFHTRIELRQIGIRDEARLVGGLGICGRPLCCSTFLSDFGQVSIKMAKEQGLSINNSKISGCCGRLMCCLRYEQESYAAEARLTPKKDTRVTTPDGDGVITETNPLAATVKVQLDKAPDEAPVTYHRDRVTPILPTPHAPADKTDSGDTDATK